MMYKSPDFVKVPVRVENSFAAYNCPFVDTRTYNITVDLATQTCSSVTGGSFQPDVFSSETMWNCVSGNTYNG